MTSKEIRKKYLDYFISKNHALVASDSLLPENDHTVLFTTAGMQQFVPNLMGKPHPKGKRLCSAQKCVRTNDIDEVGDNRHLTYFEMLGNWSLGDYFKKGAIQMSFEFLTKELKIPAEKIWVTVFGGDKDIPLDTESIEIWKKLGIPEERIIPIGPKPGGKKGRGDNFWGPAGSGGGPCGPCTEMYVYIGKEKPKKEQTPATDETDFIEVWNDVLMEFNQDADGKLTKLAAQNVDTGMGLERIVMVLNGNPTIFETDSFSAVITATEKISKKKYPPYSGDIDVKNPITRAMRIIADHSRAATHIIADGAIPSNEGRGYVLRRLIRRAVRYGRTLGINTPFLTKISDAYIQDFKEFYPEIEERKETIFTTIKIEEEKFFETLERGEKILEEILEKNPKVISGEDAFKLFDTYGFPLDITRDIAREKGISVDERKFDQEMEQQKKRSREGKGEFFDRKNADRKIFENLPKTKFIGYEKNEGKSKILAIQEVGEGIVEFALDETPFYAESGGQVADTGLVESDSGIKIEVQDVQKMPNGVFVHIGKIISGESPLEKENKVFLKIDVERREQIRRHHSLAHLLHAALKQVLGKHVEQQGSLVESTRTRFDFSHPKAVTKEEIREIEQIICDWVNSANEVATKEMPLEEAKKAGAEALFSEKYENIVRTIRMGDKSFELCGGTHVRNTADIGAIKIISESSVASGIRRMELVCAKEAQRFLWKLSDMTESIAASLKTPVEQLEERVKIFLQERKDLENEHIAINKEIVRLETDELIPLQKDVNGKKVVCEPIPTGDKKKIGALARELVQRGIDVAVTFTRDGGISVASKGKISAKDILQKITEFAGGSGGGAQNFAQGAGVNLEQFQEIRKRVEEECKM